MGTWGLHPTVVPTHPSLSPSPSQLFVSPLAAYWASSWTTMAKGLEQFDTSQVLNEKNKPPKAVGHLPALASISFTAQWDSFIQ